MIRIVIENSEVEISDEGFQKLKENGKIVDFGSTYILNKESIFTYEEICIFIGLDL